MASLRHCSRRVSSISRVSILVIGTKSGKNLTEYLSNWIKIESVELFYNTGETHCNMTQPITIVH
jgi:hypothetical protein